jgi:hypothetical protein
MNELEALRQANAEKAARLIETGLFNNPMAAISLDIQGLKLRLDALTKYMFERIEGMENDFEVQYESAMGEFLAEQLDAMNRVQLLRP